MLKKDISLYQVLHCEVGKITLFPFVVYFFIRLIFIEDFGSLFMEEHHITNKKNCIHFLQKCS